MLEQIFRLLSGYVKFRVNGDGPRFFTIAAKLGFGLWDFRRENGQAVACVKPRTYKKLRQVSRRCGISTRVLQKRGLPFQWKRLWKRKGFVLGTAAGAALYVFLSGFIWGVQVVGTEKITRLQVLQAAEAYGVYLGGTRRELSPKNAGYGILSLVPELSWANVNTDGCFVEVAVKEGAAAPEVEDSNELSNIVAVRAGQVVELEAQQGRPEVALGETVTEGQLLIAGLYQEIPDPYAPLPEKLFQRSGPARGRVVAETYREFTVQVGSQQTEQVEAGKSSALWAEVFGVRIPLGLWTKQEGHTRIYRETSQARVLGVELPLSLEREVTVYLEEQPRALTEEEQRAAALRKLREAQRAALPEGGTVKEETLEYVFTDGMCILSAKCRCLEEIGKLQKISVE